MPSTYLNHVQRQNLISQYEEQAEEMGDDFDRQQLESLSNPELIAECRAFMPDCMDSV